VTEEHQELASKHGTQCSTVLQWALALVSATFLHHARITLFLWNTVQSTYRTAEKQDCGQNRAEWGQTTCWCGADQNADPRRFCNTLLRYFLHSFTSSDGRPLKKRNLKNKILEKQNSASQRTNRDTLFKMTSAHQQWTRPPPKLSSTRGESVFWCINQRMVAKQDFLF